MTMDATSLNNRMFQNTKGQSLQQLSKDKYRSIVVNMDFNKWNSFMRREETDGLFLDFDNLFGFSNVFRRTHDMFEHSTLYLADGTFTPSFDCNTQMMLESDYSWRGHIGGIEGLRQKGWTIFTVTILKLIAEEFDINCQLMGQGDNQVLIYKYMKDTPNIREIHEDFIDSLEMILKKIGPPLKARETWMSSLFFIYGTNPIYKGIPLGLSQKKLSRANRLTNEQFQNLESTLSSIAANASSASTMDQDPVIPYLTALFESIGAIKLHLIHCFYGNPMNFLKGKEIMKFPSERKAKRYFLEIPEDFRHSFERLDSSIIMTLLSYPCCLGGFAVIQLVDLISHGFLDPVGLNLWGLKTLYENARRLHQIATHLHGLSNPVAVDIYT